MPASRITLLSLLRGLLATSLLVLSMPAFNLFQTVSILLLPLSRPLFRHLNEYLSEIWWRLNWFVNTAILGHQINFIGHQNFPQKENAIVIANHQSMVDILAITGLAVKLKVGANCKFFAKDPLKYSPGIGLGMQCLNYIFLKRNWTRDADSILKTFENLRKNKIPFFLVNFPEGTRSSPAKRALSQAFARQKNLKPLDLVMIPRTKGVVSTIQGLRGHFAAVYDLTLHYQGRVPSLAQFYFCEVGPITLYSERFSPEQLPADDQGLTQWLYGRFEAKDLKLKALPSA